MLDLREKSRTPSDESSPDDHGQSDNSCNTRHSALKCSSIYITSCDGVFFVLLFSLRKLNCGLVSQLTSGVLLGINNVLIRGINVPRDAIAGRLRFSAIAF